MADLSRYVELTEYNFLFATACILFNPLFWNVVARWEYRTRTLSRTFGSPYVACYILGAVLIFLAIFRSHCFSEAMSHQPHWWILKRPEFYYLGAALVASGGVLVVSSFLALGFAGTYLGDYFGILMEEKVTGFPFNVMENPMYWGSTANYLGLALLIQERGALCFLDPFFLTYTSNGGRKRDVNPASDSQIRTVHCVKMGENRVSCSQSSHGTGHSSRRNSSPAGLALTAVVALCYKVAIWFEGPFTEKIYRNKEKSKRSH